MKTKNVLIAAALVAIIAVVFNYNSASQTEISVEELREKHRIALENSPFKHNKTLSRQERKNLGLPPNAYNEQMWELIMDPTTGRPMPERVLALQEQLRLERQSTRGVGGDNSNPWIDRGPNNVGGRTRGIMFDPNDSNNERVFAGGVSGGLWVNQDITDANSSWTLVPGIGANISVTAIIADPNDSNTFYIGSGESYTSGAAIGRGIWKSTDAGVTWTNIFGGYTGTTGTQLINGIFYVNDIIARNVGGSTELYASIAGEFFGDSGPSQFHGLQEQGVYRSINNGNTWTKITINDGSGNPKNPNDLELDINNNIWMATTRSSWGTSNGGEIYRSTNGTTFTQVGSIPGARRTELEPSPTNANQLWVAANVPGGTNQADLFSITYNTGPGTITTTALNEPNDADTGIPATDYTRGQAFYNLPIESDASGNLIVGGIDLFRSTDGGTNWTQISRWNSTISGPSSIVHADMHAVVQRPGAGNENKYVFGTDGGLYYSDNITNAGSSSSNITARNRDYNTLQFYYGSIDESDAGDGDDLVGGSQDNGTQFVIDAAAGANAFFDPVGGDGGFSEIDDGGQYAISTYPFNSHVYLNYPSAPNTGFFLTTAGPSNNPNGSFINEAGLDKNLDILYSNASVGATNRIERVAEFLPGGAAQVNTFLTDANLNAAPTAFKISPFTTGSSKLFLGLINGRLLRVDNADTTPSWNIITGPSFAGSISDIEFGENENEIFVTMFNYGITSIWFTDDGGSNWSSKEGNLPDLPVRCILQNPLIPDEVIIGTELGVWATGDYTQPSPTWIQTYNGMSDVTVVDLDVRTSDNVILATTHGRGLFTSQFTSSTLGINDTSFDENTLTLYPTISDGNFTLKTNRALGEINFSIYDLSGKQVYRDKFLMNSNKKEFNLSLNGGIYLAKIQSDKSIITKKIIIK